MATSTYRTTAVSTTNDTSYTFSSLAIGTASKTRTVIIALAMRKAGTTVPTITMTIGGIASNLADGFVADTGDGNYQCTGFYSAIVPTGTTATVVVSTNATWVRCGVSVFTSPDEVSAIDQQGAAGLGASASISMSRSGNGFVLGVVMGGNGTFTWTGLTERYDAVIESATGYSVANVNTSVTTALTCNATCTVSGRYTSSYVTFEDVRRYWVGNGGSWQSTARWALTSGGASGASIPTSTFHKAIFDANSFSTTSQAVTSSSATLNIKSVDFTGVTNNPDFSGPSGYLTFSTTDSLILVSGITFSSLLKLTVTTTSPQITDITVDSAGHQLIEFRVTAPVTIVGDVHLIPNSGSTSGRAYLSWSSANNNFGNVYFDSVGTLNAYGNFGVAATIASLTMPAGSLLEIDDGTTVTINALAIDGAVGNPTTIDTYDGEGGQHTILGGANFNVSYASISNSNVSGIYDYNAINSTDGGNNIGWNITPPSNMLMMFS